MGKGRLEAFTDGVLAVAITLLVLDLHVDTESTSSLARQLSDEWPSFAAYGVSFFVIGVIWINHHALLALAARVDRVLMFYNLLLLLFVTTIPFTTSTLAEYLQRRGPDERIAVLLYGGVMEGMAISFTLMLSRIARAGLAFHPVSPAEANQAIRRFGLGDLVYPASTLIGLLNATAMLILMAAITAFYMFEQTPPLPSEAADVTG